LQEFPPTLGSSYFTCDSLNSREKTLPFTITTMSGL
jgi:hypothetical protein